MIDINSLTIDQIYHPSFSFDILQEGEELVKGAGGRRAKDFALALEKKINLESKKEVLNELDEKYLNLIIRLKFSALANFTEKEVFDLFQNHLVAALDTEAINIKDRLKAKLLDIIPTKRDAFKEKLRQALYLNNQKLTHKYLLWEDKEVAGTVGNWLRDYIKNLGTGKIDKVKQIQYLTNSLNTKDLTPMDRERIMKFFDLYEFLKLSSITPEGVDEDILFIDEEGQFSSLDGIQIKKIDFAKYLRPPKFIKKISRAVGGGVPVSILEEIRSPSKPKKEISELKDEIVTIYQGDLKEQKEILEDEATIKSQIEKFKTEEEKEKELAQILEQGLDQRDKIKSIAVLRLLTERKALDKLLTENKRFIDPFLGYLKQKEEETPGLLEGFRLEPTAPNYLSLFLQYLLRDKLRLNENDSGRVGMQLVNIFKKAGNEKYSKLVYFDVREEKFRWSV